MLPLDLSTPHPSFRIRSWPAIVRPRRHRALAILALWGSRIRQRRALAQLDDRMLRDIGLTRYDALRESAKPFWR